MRVKKLPGVPSTGKENYIPPLRKAAVVSQPQTYQVLIKGINLILEALRPTLGPLPRLVVLERLKRTEVPEFLDDGATIARRITQIKPRGYDVGAMLVRHALWKMHMEVGDGSTTMGVMYQAIVNEGVRYITEFGCNAMLLRSGLEKGLEAILQTFAQDAIPLMGRVQIARIARGMCQEDTQMADMMGEIFDIVGPEGLIVVEGWNKWGLEREYIEGTYWKLSGWFSRLFVTDQAEKRTVFEDAALLISDLEFKDPNQLIPALEKCVKAGVKKLVIICTDISDSAVGLLVSNNQAKTIETMAVRTPRTGEMIRVAALEDIAILTGGKAFYKAADHSFEELQLDDLGHARRAWATESLFGIYGGKGDPRQIRKQIVNLKGMSTKAEEVFDKRMIEERLGRLSGGTAILRVGGIHETEREARKAVAERAVTGLRNAILGGVVLGGGAALLNAQSALAGLVPQHEEDTVAWKILARALEEPMRTIAKNAGFVPDVIVEKVKSCPKGYGFDARNGQLVDMKQMGILDSVLMLQKALEIAVSGAEMALTTEVIIHHKNPKECLEP